MHEEQRNEPFEKLIGASEVQMHYTYRGLK